MTDGTCILYKDNPLLNWTDLPTVVRDAIFEALRRHRRIAPYATVCKEWQAAIEKKIFYRLKFRQSDLDEFERIAKRKKDIIKSIWLNIELLQYTCQTCRLLETDKWIRKNNIIISEGISRLFSILHTWEPTTKGGMTLEFNAYSPSDQEHWFRGCYFGAQGENDALESNHEPQNNISPVYDAAHDLGTGWELEPIASNERAIQRPFEEIDLKFPEELPQVEIVTRFVLRRQCRRQWDPTTLKYLWGKLPRLEHIVYEPWQSCDEVVQRIQFDRHYVQLINGNLPTGLKSIRVFEDFNEKYLDFILRHQSTPFYTKRSAIRTSMPAIGAAFATQSLKLEHLSVAFMAEAKHFFEACQPQWNWEHLESLTLTSRLMTRGNRAHVIGLLRTAGRVALCMPKLQILAIWNGARREACAFTYRKKDDTITWRGTWDIQQELCGGVLADWNRVAARELQFKVQTICCDIRSHGDAIYHLGLPPVIDPVSMRQIQMEHNRANTFTQ
ncbi:hypothetical protein V8C42DRAFT_359572 [Trichoderma barbatum]